MNPPEPAVQGVVFDMDGLLLDTERVYLAGFRATMDAFGLAPDDALFVRMVGTNAQAGQTILGKGLAGRADPEAFDLRWRDWVQDALNTGIPTKPGVRDLILALRQRGTAYIIATSTRTDRAHAHLAKAGLGDLFPDVIGGDQVSRSKPAPDIYLRATATLSLEPATCAAFEDSPNGVRAAHAAGLITVQIPDVVPPDAEIQTLAHHIAPDLLSGARHLGLFPHP